MILLHLILLGSVVLVAMGCIVARFGTTPRPASVLVNAIVPMIVVGVLCTLVLNANGQPRAEWIIPTLAILVVGLFCRSEALFRVTKWGMLVLSVGLCVNFLNIVQAGGYTAAPSHTRDMANQFQKSDVRHIARSIQEKHGPTEVLPKGPVGAVDSIEIAAEWHTPITRIHKVNHSKAKVWYPGGPVSESVGKLVVATK